MSLDTLAPDINMLIRKRANDLRSTLSRVRTAIHVGEDPRRTIQMLDLAIAKDEKAERRQRKLEMKQSFDDLYVGRHPITSDRSE